MNLLPALLKKSTFLMLLIIPYLCACAQTSIKAKPQTDRELKGMGMVIVYTLAPDASKKEGVYAVNQAGNIMFSPSGISQGGSGVSAIGAGLNTSFPRWVRVTWREGADIRSDYQHGGWIGGKVVGDYTIEVLSRIPEEVFAYATAARGRAIVLRFRIKDHGVLLAWDVQESSVNGQGWVYKMHGGDFLDAEVYNGKVINPGWEKP